MRRRRIYGGSLRDPAEITPAPLDLERPVRGARSRVKTSSCRAQLREATEQHTGDASTAAVEELGLDDALDFDKPKLTP